MKFLSKIIVLCGLSWSGMSAFQINRAEVIPELIHFVVVIPSYNNSGWVERNIRSALDQAYKNYSIRYIDDASLDGTGMLAMQHAAQYADKSISITVNKERCGALKNIYDAVHACDDRSVIVTLDGDDWFAHSGVLARLNEEYQSGAVWMTYGQYLKWPYNQMGGSRQVPDEVIAHNTFRYAEWCTSHLRTFYAGLFKKIKREDLLFNETTFFPAAWDLAFMIPMLEMSGWHSRFIPDILYIYNLTNPISDYRINVGLTGQCGAMITQKSPYMPLDRLF